jgi:hypothetical protein
VLTRNVEPGDLVQPGRVLFEIERRGEAFGAGSRPYRYERPPASSR